MALRVSIDQPVGHLAVRLLDIHPDGSSFRVSWGVINLTHRTSHADPQAVVELGKIMDMALVLDESVVTASLVDTASVLPYRRHTGLW